MRNPPIVRQPAVVIDVSDLERGRSLLAGLLGVEPGQPRSSGRYLTVGHLSSDVLLVLQKVPEHKTSKNRVHLDFTVTDVDAAIRRITDLGGSELHNRTSAGGVTMTDPEGKEFCIAAFTRTASGERVPAGPTLRGATRQLDNIVTVDATHCCLYCPSRR